jgi:hypothetical protein
MVWQFERFEGVPVIHDYNFDASNLSIIFLPEELPRSEIDLGNMGEGRFYDNLNFNVIIDQMFVPNSKGCDLVLSSNGLNRKLWSEVKDPRTPNIIESTWKNVGLANYEEMKFFGDNFFSRFYFIPNEIKLPVGMVSENLPLYAVNCREWYRESLEDIDWEDFKSVVGKRSCEMFKNAIRKRMASHQIPEMTPEQARSLDNLLKDY